ncbi:MAG TPA: purine-nucleoside phosphorylase [Terriglobia bacterium]|nr:purine-nucleoside phosphorylase [Terriglobia bacterium]
MPQSKIANRKSKMGGPGYDEAQTAARYIVNRAKIQPRVGIILGSGLGEVVAQLENARHIPYREIPHFPRSTVAGHAGEMLLGTWMGQPTAILSGRMHLYEGYTPAEVVLPTRALALAGIEFLFVTCAAGGIGNRCTPGALMILSDHLNYQVANPLTGPEDKRLGPRFIDMSEPYDAGLRALARSAARKLRLRCSEGVYAALLGPSFETSAEIRALKRLGADAVGMSTVPEVIAARQCGVRVLAVASITNRAAGLSRRPLSHQEVLDGGRRGAGSLARLFNEVMAQLPAAQQQDERREK